MAEGYQQWQGPPPGAGQVPVGPDGAPILPQQYNSQAVAQAINQAPPKAHWTGSVGMTIAIVVFLILIIWIFVWLFGNNNGKCGGGTGSSWTINYISTASSNGTPYAFTAFGGNVYGNTSSSTSPVWNVASPSSPVGQAFIIDNVSGAGGLLVQASSSGGTGGISSVTVPQGQSYQLVWVSSGSFRVYPFTTY